MQLVQLVDALTAIGNHHGFDTKVEVVVEDQSCGIVVKEKRLDEMGNEAYVRVGSVDVPLQRYRCLDDA